VRRFLTPTEPRSRLARDLAEKPVLISARPGRARRWPHFSSALTADPQGDRRPLGCETEVVYVSPLKALSNDVQKNLETPLREIQQLALERGYLCPLCGRGADRRHARSGAARHAEDAATHPGHDAESLYICSPPAEPRASAARAHGHRPMRFTRSPTTNAARIWRSAWSGWTRW